jgi:adenylate kinase
MASASDRTWTALLGPPAAGKSTLTAAVDGGENVAIFRIREFASTCRAQGWLPGDTFGRRDHLGWFDDATVASLLRLAFAERRFGDHRFVIFENFPGSARQLHLLHESAVACGADLGILELTATDATLLQRILERRVCAGCEPDPFGDPHRPARAAAGRPHSCAACGGLLSPRLSDAPGVFRARLDRYRTRITAIRAAAATAGLPVSRHNTDASSQPSHAHALATLRSLRPDAASPAVLT